MKVRRVKIEIKSAEELLEGAKEVMEKLERGKRVKKRTGVYFTSIEAFRKALTPKRLELLRIIKTQRPHSINELARMAKRDIKNVADDVEYLEQVGLLEKQEEGREVRPFVNYDKIDLEIAV